jgi:hypothetical protein
MTTTGAASPVVIDPDGGLFGRRSVLGGAFVLLVLTFFGVGLQAIDHAVRSRGLDTVGPVAVTDTLSFTPEPGWVEDAGQSIPGLAVAAHKNGWELKVNAGIQLEPGQTVADFAEIFRSGAGDGGATVSDTEAFTTSSGSSGVTWEVHGTTTTSITWLVAEGSELAQMYAEGPNNALSVVEPELDQMAESMTIEGADT